MKPLIERNKMRSSMEYLTPAMPSFKKLPNILLGESESELKRKAFNDDYKE
jgi:hypothetical protein